MFIVSKVPATWSCNFELNAYSRRSQVCTPLRFRYQCTSRRRVR